METTETFLHQEIYESLENWALHNGVADDQMVVGLLEDLKNEENLYIWANLDPFEFLPASKFSNINKYEKWAKSAALIRNIMVFVPVALTWKAVSEATAAFGKFIDSNSASTVNFLAFWQNGYDILPKFWTISHVASLDFLIIAAVILLSIASTFLTQKSQADRRENSYSAGQERIQMALALKIYLYSMREIDKGNIKEGIASSVSALQSATSALTKTAIELNTIMSGLKKSIPAVNDFGVRMQEETAKLNRQVAKLTDNFASINGSIIEELRSAVSSASDGLRLANDELNDSTESIRKNANDAEREIRTLQGVIKRASKLGK